MKVHNGLLILALALITCTLCGAALRDNSAAISTSFTASTAEDHSSGLVSELEEPAANRYFDHIIDASVPRSKIRLPLQERLRQTIECFTGVESAAISISGEEEEKEVIVELVVNDNFHEENRKGMKNLVFNALGDVNYNHITIAAE